MEGRVTHRDRNQQALRCRDIDERSGHRRHSDTMLSSLRDRCGPRVPNDTVARTTTTCSCNSRVNTCRPRSDQGQLVQRCRRQVRGDGVPRCQLHSCANLQSMQFTRPVRSTFGRYGIRSAGDPGEHSQRDRCANVPRTQAQLTEVASVYDPGATGFSDSDEFDHPPTVTTIDFSELRTPRMVDRHDRSRLCRSRRTGPRLSHGVGTVRRSATRARGDYTRPSASSTSSRRSSRSSMPTERRTMLSGTSSEVPRTEACVISEG